MKKMIYLLLILTMLQYIIPSNYVKQAQANTISNPISVATESKLDGPIAVAVDTWHSLALDEDGNVRGLGDNHKNN